MNRAGRDHQYEEMSPLGLYLEDISDTQPLSAQKETDLAKRIRVGDQDALEELVKANLRFVVRIAKKYQNQGLPLEDLISEGNLGLIEAAKRFDETKGFKFISYAVWWIRQGMLSALAQQSRMIRLPLNRVSNLHKISKTANILRQYLGRDPTILEIADELGVDTEYITNTLQISRHHLSLDDSPSSNDEDNNLLSVLKDELASSPDQNVMDESFVRALGRALDALKDREAEVLRLYFGIGKERPMTLEEIGQVFGLTRERVRQIKEKAISKLRHPSRSRPMKTYLD